MSDQRDGGTEARLRALERRAQETRAPADHYAFRVACLRLGQPARAGLEVGDRVAWPAQVGGCSHCAGTGYGPPNGHEVCPTCHGSAAVPTTEERHGRIVELLPRVACWPLCSFVDSGTRYDLAPVVFPDVVRLVAPRDPTRAKAPPRLPERSRYATWRERIAPLVNRVLSLTAAHGAPEREISKALSACYAKFFGPKEHHVYKAWCAEVRAQRGLEPHPRKAKTERAAAASRPVPLFDQAFPGGDR